MDKIFCPNCYAEYETEPEQCECGYPFKGSEMDKYKFMSNRMKKRQTIHEGIESAKYARTILFLIGGINLIVAIIQLFTQEETTFSMITMIYSIVLIGLGFLSYKEPFYSLLLGFIIILAIYFITGIIDFKLLLSGLILKISFIAGFIYGLVKIKQANKLLGKEGN